MVWSEFVGLSEITISLVPGPPSEVVASVCVALLRYLRLARGGFELRRDGAVVGGALAVV